MEFCPRCSSKMKILHSKYCCPICNNEQFQNETVRVFSSPKHSDMRSQGNWDRTFKNIEKYEHMQLTMNSNLVISIATRFNYEKVVYINRQGSTIISNDFKDKGVRVPFEQISNLIKCLQDSKSRYKNFDKFAAMDRLEVGPNTDVVLSWFPNPNTRQPFIFLNYRSQLDKNYDYESKGVEIPFESVDWVCKTLENVKSQLRK